MELKFTEIIVVQIIAVVKSLKVRRDQIANGALLQEIRLIHVAKFMTGVVEHLALEAKVVTKKFYPVWIK